MPTSVHRIMELTRDPSASVQDITKVISTDQALTANVLRWCNSPFYGFAQKISSVNQAVSLLGFSTISSMVIATTVRSIYNRELSGYGLGAGELWKHSVACALGSRILAVKKAPALKNIAFTAGLLHDIGKIILSNAVENSFAEIQGRVKREKLSFVRAEKESLGFDHTEIGEKAAERWLFPDPIREAIRFHHEPLQARDNKMLVSFVHVSNLATSLMGFGLGCDGLLNPVTEDVLKSLSLEEKEFDIFCSDLVLSVSKIPEFQENQIGK